MTAPLFPAGGSVQVVVSNRQYRLDHFSNTVSSYFDDVRQLLLADKMQYQKYEDRIFIERLYFGVTNICNANCVYCAYGKTVHPKGVMTFETFRKAIDQFTQMGGERVSFTPTVGDPLLDSGLLKKIHYAVHLPGVKQVYFYTNGFMLAACDMYKKLVDSGLTEIHISTAGCDREMFEQLHRVKAYDQAMDGISKLLAHNKQQGGRLGVILEFRASVYPRDVITSPDFVKFIAPHLHDKVSLSFMTDYDNWGGMIKESDLVGVMKLRRNRAVKREPCIRTFDAMVLFDGSVRLCACRLKQTEFDGLVVGNIHQNTLGEIFYGEQAKAVRASFGQRDYVDVCQQCSFYIPATRSWIERRVGERKVAIQKGQAMSSPAIDPAKPAVAEVATAQSYSVFATLNNHESDIHRKGACSAPSGATRGMWR